MVAYGELNVDVSPSALVDVLNFLKRDVQCQFVSIIDICGVDYPARRKRFDVVYHLLSPRQNLRIRVRTQTDEQMPVPSVTEIFPGADWFEREAYDLYGILFTGHSDLRRILTDYGFEGHPLRKDFPLTASSRCANDDEAKRVVYEPVELKQEFRNFDFLSPWEGNRLCASGRREGEAVMAETNVRNFNINFGPQHPAAHGVLRLCLSSTAKSSSASIRISASCIAAPRSLIEAKTYLQAVPVFRPLGLCRADEPGALPSRLPSSACSASRCRSAGR